MNRRELLGRAATVGTALAGVVGTADADADADLRAATLRRAADGPTVSTRGHYRIGPFNFVYRTLGVGRYEYRTSDVPGIDGPAPDEVAVFVHGWAIDEADADTTFGIVRETLRSVGYDAPLVGFEWDADDVYWFDDWYASVEIARRNGGKLARFLADLRRSNPDTAVRLVGHSLGTRVVAAALESLATDDHPTGDWDGVVESVTLLGAALDDEAPTTLGEYANAIETRAGEVDNFHTTADEKLATGYRSVEFDDPLGTVGADGFTPDNYEDRRADPVGDHFDYYRQDVGVLDVAVAEWRDEGDADDPAPPEAPDLPDPGDPDGPSDPDPTLPDPGDPTDPGDGGDPDRTVSGTVPAGQGRTHGHEVTPGTDRLVVTLSGPAGADLDLYLTLDGRTPTTTDSDRQSWGLGSDERIEVVDPGPSVGLLVDAFAGGGEYTLTVAER